MIKERIFSAEQDNADQIFLFLGGKSDPGAVGFIIELPDDPADLFRGFFVDRAAVV